MQIPKPSLESFFRTFAITDFSVRPDGTQVVYSTNMNGFYNLWGFDVAHPYPYLITSVNQQAMFIKHAWDSSFILSGFDQDGDENWSIARISPEGGELAWILKEDQEKFYFGGLSKDNRHLYYYTSRENPEFHNIRVLNLVTKEDRLLVEGQEGPLYFSDLSPCGTSYAYQQSLGNTMVVGYVAQGDERISLVPTTQTKYRVNLIRYWDTTKLYLITNYGSEFSYLASFDLTTREFTKEAECTGMELEYLALDREKGRILFAASRGVEDFLYSFDVETKNVTALSSPVELLRKIEVTESGDIFLLGQSAVSPLNIFHSKDLTSFSALTKHRVFGTKKEQLSQPEVFRYPSFDGTEIEALYYAPKDAISNGHTILWPHGGPQSADRKRFMPLLQYLVLEGYAVFCANYRGSSGYGESFMNLVNRDWGGGPRLDLVTGMDVLNSTGRSHEDKWFCLGGSYGGYMSLLLHGRHADRFKAFVDEFGPSCLFTTLATAPEHWKKADEELIGHCVRDKEKLIQDSPITYVDQMTKPMLVVQGAKDPRVVQKESDVIVEQLRSRGQHVEYLLLPDEGHGFSKTENAIRVYKTIVEFLNGYLEV